MSDPLGQMRQLELCGGRQQGKQIAARFAVEQALARGDSVILAVPDQAAGIARWSEFLPGALFEIIGDWGLKIHRRPG